MNNKPINNSKFKKELGRKSIYFKCISGANTKLLD